MRLALLFGLLAALAIGCQRPTPGEARGAQGARDAEKPYQTGQATYYGGKFHGRKTASGERYDKNGMTAAHRRLPFGTVVRVTNLENGRSVEVRITDRGPFGKRRRIIDVSEAAARELGFIRDGVTRVRLDIVERP